MNEKRKKPRIKIEIIGSLKIENKNISVNIIEIGVGGLCFLSKTLLVYGEEGNIFFKLENKNIAISGRICRINGNKYVFKYNQNESNNIIFINNFILSCYWGKEFKKLL